MVLSADEYSEAGGNGRTIHHSSMHFEILQYYSLGQPLKGAVTEEEEEENCIVT